jgi:hypothetical protein
MPRRFWRTPRRLSVSGPWEWVSIFHFISPASRLINSFGWHEK